MSVNLIIYIHIDNELLFFVNFQIDVYIHIDNELLFFVNFQIDVKIIKINKDKSHTDN